MELRQVRAVIALDEHRHFGRAAAAIGLSQPALSQAVKVLEDRLGAALFDRDTRHVTVTRAGRDFLAQARTAVSLLDAAADRARAAGRGEAGTLAIGMIGSAMVAPVPRVLRAFRARFPDVQITFAELTTAGQVDRLRAGTLDVGFLRPPLPAPADTELDLTVIAREPLLAVLPRQHRLAGRARVPVAALADEPFVRTPRNLGPGFHDQVTALCRQAGFEPRVTQEAVRMDTVIGLVGAGFGISIVPGPVAAAPPDVVFAPLTPAGPPVDLALARPRRHSSPLVDTFAAFTRDLTTSPARH